MSCFIPRSEKKLQSPICNCKSKSRRGWKQLLRAVGSKVPLVMRGFRALNKTTITNLRLNPQYSSTTRHYHHHHYRQYEYHHPYQEKSSLSLSVSRLEGGCGDKALVLATSPSAFITASEASRHKMEVADHLGDHTNDHDHLVLEDGVHEKAWDSKDSFYDCDTSDPDPDPDEYAVAIANSTRLTSSTCTTLQRLCGVDAQAEEFINDFKERLALERQKSVEEFYAMMARSA